MPRYRFDEQAFREAIKTSCSIRQVLFKLGIKPAGGNYVTAKHRIATLKIDTSHFLGKGYLKGKTHNWSEKIPIKEILIENSKYLCSSHLHDRLIKEKILENKCSDCGMLPVWNGKPLVLHLDHKNGIRTDQRIENLQFLCPNCHSQTDTYTGKNIGKNK